MRNTFLALGTIVLFSHAFPFVGWAHADARALWGLSVGYPMTTYAYAVRAADLDEDGWLDLVVLTQDGNWVIVMKGGPGGVLSHADTIPLGVAESYMDVADVNGDGDEDVVLSGPSVRVLPGLSGIGFGAAQVLGTGSALELEDVTGDLVPDIIAGQNLFPGMGSGVFGAPVGLAWPASSALVAADLDGDGDIDLASHYEDPSEGNGIGVLENPGDGAFGSPTFHASALANGVQAGDLDEDDAMDLVTSNGWMGGNGDGTFAAAVYFEAYPEESPEWYPAVGDVDGDGHLDVVTTSYRLGDLLESWITLYRGRGDGTVHAPTRWPVGWAGLSLALADLNNNGRLEVVVGCFLSRLLVFYTNPDGSFGSLIEAGTGGLPVSLAVGELAGNAAPDAVVAIADGPALRLLPGVGDGTFGAPLDLPAAADIQAVAFGDLDGNGVRDLVSVSSSLTSVHLGTGGGSFAPRVDYTGGGTKLAVGDLNGDGRDDVVVGPDIARRFLSGPTGTLAAPTTHAGQGFDIAIGNLNGDAFPDVIVGRSNSVSHFPGSASGTLGGRIDAAITAFGSTFVSATFGDVDADGDVDAVYSSDPGPIRIYLGNGTGGFASTPISLSRRTANTALGDIDEDGKVDLVAAEYFFATVGVHRGFGGGMFQLGPGFGSGSNTTEVRCADMDGDGHLDVVAMNRGSQTVSVLLNTLDEVGVGDGIPGGASRLGFRLAGANPARDGVNVAFRLPVAGTAALDLVDVSGRRVARQDMGVLGAGEQRARFERPSGVRAGLYWLRLTVGTERAAQRLVFLD